VARHEFTGATVASTNDKSCDTIAAVLFIIVAAFTGA
jgi:hypothetical protein